MTGSSPELLSLASSSTVPISTPDSAISMPTQLLKLGKTQCPLQVPVILYTLTAGLFEDFAKEYVAPPEESTGSSDGHQELILLTEFVAFVSRRQEDESFTNQQLFCNVLGSIMHEIDETYVRGRDIHSVVSAMDIDHRARLSIISSYYKSMELAGRSPNSEPSGLLARGQEGSAKIYAVFGGQGLADTYLDELRELYETYKGFSMDILQALSRHLQSLASDSELERLYPHGLDVEKWLCEPETQPDATYLTSAPVSMPLIGLTQLMHYSISCSILQITPGQFRESLKGVTGHSQGVIIATAISRSSSWMSFKTAANEALTMLFWTGARSQQTFPIISIPETILRDCSDHEEATPGPMIRIVGLNLPAVQAHINDLNLHLPVEKHIYISLVNGPHNIIVAGPPLSLYGLNLKLRKLGRILLPGTVGYRT